VISCAKTKKLNFLNILQLKFSELAPSFLHALATYFSRDAKEGNALLVNALTPDSFLVYRVIAPVSNFSIGFKVTRPRHSNKVLTREVLCLGFLILQVRFHHSVQPDNPSMSNQQRKFRSQ